MAAEEAHNPERDMPKGILYGLATLTVCAFLTLILNTRKQLVMSPEEEFALTNAEPKG